MIGKRRDLTEDQPVLENAGEYGKGTDGVWYMRPPKSGFGMGSLKLHTVVEHEDGTITVSPSA